MKKSVRLLVLVLALVMAFSFGLQSVAFAADAQDEIAVDEPVADAPVEEAPEVPEIPEVPEAPELSEMPEGTLAEVPAEDITIEESAAVEASAEAAAVSFDVYKNSLGTWLTYTGNEPTVVFPSTYNGEKVMGVRGISPAAKGVVTSIVIEEGITNIHLEAFKDCKKLTSVQMPNTLQIVDFGAFSGCSAIKSISFPKSVQEIYSAMFQNCTSLTKVVIPNKATKVYTYASMFTGCKVSNIYIHGVPGSTAEALAINAKTKFRATGSFSVPAPKNLTVKLPYGTYNKVEIKFSQSVYSQKYEIYRSNSKDKGYKLVKTVAPTSAYSSLVYTDTVDPGRTYYYKVRAVSNYSNPVKKSGFTNPRAIKPMLAKPYIYSTIMNNNTAVRVYWNKIEGATGYFVYRNENDGAYKLIATLGGTTLEYMDGAIPRSGKFSYKMVPFKTIGTKNYNGYTSNIRGYEWKTI